MLKSEKRTFGEYYEEPASPWDWWNNTYYDAAFSGYHGAPAGYGAANSILGNPDMSAAKGRAYIDTIQGYLNPRMYVALNLGGASSIHDAVNNILDDKKFKIFGDSAKKFSESFYWNKIVKKYLNLIN